MNENNLSTLSPYMIERLCKNFILYSAPETLVDVLLKYVPKMSELHSEEYRYRMKRYHAVKLNNSLFEI